MRKFLDKHKKKKKKKKKTTQIYVFVYVWIYLKRMIYHNGYVSRSNYNVLITKYHLNEVIVVTDIFKYLYQIFVNLNSHLIEKGLAITWEWPFWYWNEYMYQQNHK